MTTNRQEVRPELSDCVKRREEFLKHEQAAMNAFYDNLLPVREIVGKEMDSYVVSDCASKDVMCYILEQTKKSIRDGEGRLFTYGHKTGVGLIMILNDRGKELFMELDSLDPRISETYRNGKFVPLGEDTPQRRDILSIDNASGIADLVGGEKRTTDHTMETMYESAPHVMEGVSIDASELFSAAEPVMFDAHGKPTNDTFDFVTRHMKKGDMTTERDINTLRQQYTAAELRVMRSNIDSQR